MRILALLNFFILLLHTLVFAQDSEEQEVISFDTLASCNKKDFEFSNWITVINHKKVEIENLNVHIFAIEISRIFILNQKKKEFWVEFSIGPIPIHAEVHFDGETNELEICNFAHLPIIGKVKLGCGKAVKGEISICFDVRLVRGRHDFFLKDDFLHLRFNDTTVGEEYATSVELIPLPINESKRSESDEAEEED